jgi:protein QN1
LTSFDIIMPQPTGSNIAKDISISSSNSTISNISLPQVKTSDGTSLKHNITSDVSKTSRRDSPTYLTPSNVLTTSHTSDIPDHLIVTLPSVAPSISEPFIVGTSSASYVPATSLTYIPMTSPTSIPVTSTRVPVTSPTSVPITSTSVPISLPVASPISLHVPITSTSVPIIPTSIPLTNVPIVPTGVPVASPTYVPTGPSTSTHYKVDGERNLDELLKALAVEQITATIPNDIHKDNNDSHRLVSAPVNESMNGQDVMYWRNELEFEKEKVKELEEKMKDNVRREEKMQLEYARQVQDLRGQILDLRAKLRSLEQEKSKGTVKPPNMEEQERLIQGYQKENERLYSELSLTSKELKSIKSKYHEDTNRLATELANARSKCETQEQTIRHLHQQKLVSHLPYLSDRDEESEQRVEMLERKLQDSQEECQKLQGQVDQLLQSNMTLESELVTLKRDQVDVDLEEMKRKYEGQLIKLRENVNLLKEKEQTLKEKNDVLSQEIEALKRKPLHESQGKKGQPRLIRSHVTSDVRKIKDLEHQVTELQKALKSRHPNSIPALIYASSASVKDSENEDIVKYLERKIERLERDLTNKDGEVAAKISGMDKQLHEMEAIYEQQIEGLKQQIVAAEAKTKQTEIKPRSNKEDDSDSIRIENNKLKEQVLVILIL